MNTDQIQIYVRSSALGPAGIHWRNVSKPEQPKEEPEILGQAVVPDEGSKISIDSAINTVKPCLVLAKYDGQILLEVTGIDATRERCEQEGRRISEVVLWVGDANPETEVKLRKLAYCALLGLWNPESDFRSDISASISFDGLNGYKVEADVLNDMYKCPEKYFELEDGSPSSHNYLEPKEFKTYQEIRPSHNYLEPKEFKTYQEIRQLATQLRDSSFDGMETAVVISEIKQTESERWLNHRGNVAKQPEAAPVTSPIVSSKELGTASSGDVTVKKIKSKAPSIQIRRRLIVLGIALILLLLTFLTMGKQYLSNNGQPDQPLPSLEVLPMQ